MPFIPHTDTDIQTMLAAIDVKNIEQLFDEIPKELLNADFRAIPKGINEMAIARLMQQRATQDEAGLCFIGAGAYEHHIPSAILDLVSRGEFLTAYTPYQAEASQGTLQLIYEFQTMIANLMGLDVSNASLYEGASGLAEAILMAVRANKHSKSKRILIPTTVHPMYRDVAKTIVSPQGIILETIAYDKKNGICCLENLQKFSAQDIAAIVIQQPNFFGSLEDVDALTDWANEHNALVIAIVNPTAMAWLKEPGAWGKTGADIACGEGQSLGVPLASGGPYFGFMCCKQEFVRQMPGRIVGRTVDSDGKTGFTLTLQAREQHIRRSKATSNICTNQGLMVTAATIYMSLLGAEGLKRVATTSHHNTTLLRQQLAEIQGINILFENVFFHEFVLQLPESIAASKILAALAKKHIQGGFDLTPYYPELGNCILVCATETKTAEDLQAYTTALQQLLKQHATV